MIHYKIKYLFSVNKKERDFEALSHLTLPTLLNGRVDVVYFKREHGVEMSNYNSL